MQKLFDTVNFCTKPKKQNFVQCTFGTVYNISKVRLVVKTVELTLKRVSNEEVLERVQALLKELRLRLLTAGKE